MEYFLRQLQNRFWFRLLCSWGCIIVKPPLPVMLQLFYILDNINIPTESCPCNQTSYNVKGKNIVLRNELPRGFCYASQAYHREEINGEPRVPGAVSGEEGVSYLSVLVVHLLAKLPYTELLPEVLEQHLD